MMELSLAKVPPNPVPGAVYFRDTSGADPTYRDAVPGEHFRQVRRSNRLGEDRAAYVGPPAATKITTVVVAGVSVNPRNPAEGIVHVDPLPPARADEWTDQTTEPPAAPVNAAPAPSVQARPSRKRSTAPAAVPADSPADTTDQTTEPPADA